jgi:hypothetical protein
MAVEVVVLGCPCRFRHIYDLLYGERKQGVIDLKSETKEGLKVAGSWREERIR